MWDILLQLQITWNKLFTVKIFYRMDLNLYKTLKIKTCYKY